MRSLRAGVAYFAIVFLCGFLLGTLRVLWLVPRLGERRAELLEAPFMLAASALGAAWVVRRFALNGSRGPALACGTLALALLLVAELGVMHFASRMTLQQYIESRDPLSFSVYLTSLGVFALLPWLIATHTRRSGRP